MMTKNRGPEGPTKDDIAWYLKVIAGQKKEILKLRQKNLKSVTNGDQPKALYELFDATGMTYYALGKASDIPAQNVKKTIDDGANIRIDTAIKLTSTLGVTLSDVLWGVGRPKESSSGAGRDSND